MKYLKLFDSFTLNESKKVGVLYHYTAIHKLVEILKSNTLSMSDRFHNISFTRNKLFHKNHNEYVDTQTRINVDGNKLSNNYKIVPYQHTSITNGNYWKGHPDRHDENEEIVLKDIHNLKEYILSIDIDVVIYNALKNINDEGINYIDNYCITNNIKLSFYEL